MALRGTDRSLQHSLKEISHQHWPVDISAGLASCWHIATCYLEAL